MKKIEFAQELVKKIEGILPDCEITITTVLKNNDVEYTGVVIKEKNSNIAPTIYIETAYDSYKKGSSVSELAKELVNVYEKHKPRKDFNIGSFTNFENVKDRIIYTLVNKESNKRNQENCVTVEYLDMLIMFKVLLSEDNEMATITIKKEHMDFWNVTENDLLNLAKENTPKLLKAEKITLADYLYNQMPEIKIMGIMPEIPPVYVVSNEKKMYGAIAILYKDMLESIAKDLGTDRLYIVPSSIHECLVMEADDETLEFKNIIANVNDEVVSEEEILPYNLYVYENGEIKIA